jgi:hypothetical protein
MPEPAMLAHATAAAPQPAPAPTGAAQPSAVSNTADLEKSDPRHQSARRFARLAVSEIILYHRTEVVEVEGRKAKNLWKFLKPDVKLSIETYEKRVPQEVRDRFNYLHDEFIRQLAEGNPEALGPEWPRPN